MTINLPETELWVQQLPQDCGLSDPNQLVKKVTLKWYPGYLHRSPHVRVSMLPLSECPRPQFIPPFTTIWDSAGISLINMAKVTQIVHKTEKKKLTSDAKHLG